MTQKKLAGDVPVGRDARRFSGQFQFQEPRHIPSQNPHNLQSFLVAYSIVFLLSMIRFAPFQAPVSLFHKNSIPLYIYSSAAA